jgi:cobalt-zinc-cadmium efflux system membrane fusion protein
MTKMSPTGGSAGRALPLRTQFGLLGAVALAAILLLFGLPLLAHSFERRPPPPPPVTPGSFVATEQQWRTLQFAAVGLHDFRSQTETEGRIATNDDRSTQVYSPFSGRITRVLVRAGEAVRAGQPLFAVSASEFVQAQADLATALAQVRLTRANEARQSDLVSANGAAVRDWQQSQADLAAAEANLGAVKNRLRVMGEGEAQIAAVERSGAPPRGVPETIVRSPIAGVVTQRSVGVGQNIGSVTNGGTNPAFVVSDLATVWLEGDMRAEDAEAARVGQAVEVRTPALPGRVFAATVDFVSPTVDPNTHRVAVRATIANPGGLLRPQTFASFRLFTDGGAKTVGAPEAAVIFEGETARVWVVHGGRALELRQVRAGLTQGGLVQILAGLKPGDRLVTSGSLFIDRAAQGEGQ